MNKSKENRRRTPNSMVTCGLTTSISTIAVVLDSLLGSNFLYKFLTEDSLSIMGTALTIYVAVSIAYVAIVYPIFAGDEQGRDIDIGDSFIEIFLWMLLLFVGQIFLLILISIPQKEEVAYYIVLSIFKILSLDVFLTYGYALYLVIVMAFNPTGETKKRTRTYWKWWR